jgi:hypothetical protein
MKIPYAARFSCISFSGAALYTWWQLLPGLPGESATDVRAAWLLHHGWQWQFGWWLWLVAIFSWMVLLVVLVWSYLPAHRVAGMLQSGLMVIAAVLAIAGMTVWMAVLPVVLAPSNVAPNLIALVDTLSMSLLNAGCLMSGVVTAWLTLDLLRKNLLARVWLGILLLAGLALVPLAFFPLHPLLLLISFFCWLIGCLWLATRQHLPRPFAEWQ